MEIYQALILGVIQGLTELLPISSSAHLFFITWFSNWNIPESFDIALHFGTLLAIGIFFFNDWIELLKGGYRTIIKRDNSFSGRMFIYIILATLPGGLIGYILDKGTKNFFQNPLIISIALIVMGIALYYIDKESPNKTNFDSLTFKQTFIIGISQALAFIPGVSRSGITITTGRILGVKRDAAAHYSFLLSGPIVLAATLFKIEDFTRVFLMNDLSNGICLIVGVFTSFIVGIIAIKFLLKYLKNQSFKKFAIYRIIIGILCIGGILIK